MKKNKILFIVFFLFIISFNLFYFGFVKEKNNEEIINKQEKVNLGYKIYKNNLIIDYPVFINSDYINFDTIIEKCSGFSYGQLIIENIDGNNFDFFPKLISKINFRQYQFDFKKYNDKDNYIFDYLKDLNSLDSIVITIKGELVGDKNLLKTFKKLRKIIQEINLEGLSINLLGGFFNDYSLSKQELEELKNYKVDSLIIMINSYVKEKLEDNYVINYLRNTRINNFYYLKNYFKQEGKIYKYENGEEILIK